MEHPNLDLALSLWQATSEADVPRLKRILDPKITWSFVDSGALDGVACGIDDVLISMARSGELVDDLRVDLIDVYASDRGAVLFYRVDAWRGPQTLNTDVLLQIEIEAGRVVSGRAMPLRCDESRQFWMSQ